MSSKPVNQNIYKLIEPGGKKDSSCHKAFVNGVLYPVDQFAWFRIALRLYNHDNLFV